MSEKQVKGWGHKELKPIKNWNIQDFTPYRIKNKHLLLHVPFLYHEVDPAFGQLGNTWWAHPFLLDRCTAPYFRKIGTNEVHYYTEIADPVKNGNNTAPDWKGIPPGERHSKPRVQREDMEPYLGPLGPIDESKKLKIYHAEKIELEYHELWGKIKKTYNHLLTAAKEGTLPVRNSTGYETDFSATRDDLRKFFTERLGERPRFLFPEERGKELAPTEDKRPPFEHSNDFRSIKMENGEILNLTKNQAKIISMLYKASPRSLSSSSLLEELYANKDNGGASESNLKKAVFSKHPHIYESLIESTGQGLHQLKPK